jgi:hypothetical protein
MGVSMAPPGNMLTAPLRTWPFVFKPLSDCEFPIAAEKEWLSLAPCKLYVTIWMSSLDVIYGVMT